MFACISAYDVTLPFTTKQWQTKGSKIFSVAANLIPIYKPFTISLHRCISFFYNYVTVLYTYKNEA